MVVLIIYCDYLIPNNYSVINKQFGYVNIGGLGKIVEIDNVCLKNVKKFFGRVLPQQWIFGGIFRETAKCCLV